jgi:protein-disulfide isomerase
MAVGARAESPAFGDEQRQAIEAIVRETLLKNPEIIYEAIEQLQQRERVAETQKARQVLAERRPQVFQDTDAPVGGNPRGDVTVVEFFDYQCGYCKSALSDVQRLLKDDGKVRFVFKEFPILGPASVVASRAALASRAQGRYVDFHNALMSHRGALDEEAVMRVARSVGLDGERLKKDMAAPEIEAAIQANKKLAEDMGIRGTPAFIVGDEIVPGAIRLDEMKKLVAAARK